MELSILIVNWNTRERLIRCIESVLAHTKEISFEVIVVDNASRDASAEAVCNHFGGNREVTLLPQDKNLGFAQANNVAYQQAEGEYILLLNPDTEIRDEAFAKMIHFLESDSAIGVVGPKMSNPDGSIQPSCRRFPRLRDWLVTLVGLHRIIPLRHYLMLDFNHQHQADVDQVMGASLMTKRSVIDQVGFLDNGFFLWFEEVDFCKRVRDAGYRVVFYPEAQVIHWGAQSFRQLGGFKRKRYVIPSLLYYFKKHGHWWDILLLRIVIPVSLGIAWIRDRVLGVTRQKS
jgi:hypothetical protein